MRRRHPYRDATRTDGEPQKLCLAVAVAVASAAASRPWATAGDGVASAVQALDSRNQRLWGTFAIAALLPCVERAADAGSSSGFACSHGVLHSERLGALRHHGFVPLGPDSDFGFTTADGQRYRDAAKTDAKFLAARGVQVVDSRPLFRGCYMALPEALESTPPLSQPVPTLEAIFLDAITWGHHCGDAAPALELRHNTSMLRLLFGENGAPLITCAKGVQKWIHVSKTFDCNAAWNHPAPNDRLCGRHLFAGAGKQNVSWQTPPSFNQFKARWQKMLEKGSEGNPGGMWSKCGPVYNFALPEVRHDLVGEHVLANVAELLDAENWECFDASWSPQGWVPSNAPGAHRRYRRWAVLQHTPRSTALERNRTAVSGRHTFLIKFQASLSSRSQNNSWSPLLEAHVETRRSDGGELWASMLGLSSPGGGMDPAWCLVLPGPQAPDHHQHRKWTLLRDAPPR